MQPASEEDKSAMARLFGGLLGGGSGDGAIASPTQAGSVSPALNSSYEMGNDTLFGSPVVGRQSPAAVHSSSKPPGIRLERHAELNVDENALEAQVPQVAVLSKVKCAYSYYLGELVAANDVAVCYVVKQELIRVLHVESGEKSLCKGHARQVFDVRFSPVAPNLLASAGRGGRILVWDVPSRSDTPVLSLRTEDSSMPDSFPNKLAWHPSEKLLAVAISTDRVYVLNVDALVESTHGADAVLSSVESVVLECSSPVTDLMFSRDDPALLATSHQNGTFCIWKWKSREVIWEESAHGTTSMSAVRFIKPDASQPEILLTGGMRCDELKLWNVADRSCTSSLKFVASSESGPNPFYNHVMPVARAEHLMLLANAKRKDFFTLHVSQTPQGWAFDYASLFKVSLSILSGVARLAKENDQEFSFSCVQTTSVQRYRLPFELCFQQEQGEEAAVSTTTAAPAPVSVEEEETPANEDAAVVVQSAARAYLARKSREVEEEEKKADDARKERLKAAQAAMKEEEDLKKKEEKAKKEKEEKAKKEKEEKAKKEKEEKAKKEKEKKEKEEKAKKEKKEKEDAAAAAKKEKEAAAAAAKKEKEAAAAAAASAAAEEEPARVTIAKRDEGEKSMEAMINDAVARNLAPFLKTLEKERTEARKRQAAEVERQKKFLQVLQTSIEERIPKAVEVAVKSALDKNGNNGKKSKQPAAADVSAALTDTVRKCFSDQLIPRVERGVTAALSGVSNDAELKSDLRHAIGALLEVSNKVNESIMLSHQQALANHTAALLDAVKGLSRGAQDFDTMRASNSASPAVTQSAAQQSAARKQRLLSQIRQEDYEGAFSEVLSLQDFSWVLWLLKKIGNPDLIEMDSLSQPVMLSLLQQMGLGLATTAVLEDETRVNLLLTWIQAVLLVLDVESPEVVPHVGTVLTPLQSKLEAAFLHWKSKDAPTLLVLFKLVMHVLNSLLRS